MSKYLIRKGKEQQLVDAERKSNGSLVGYRGWAVLEEDVEDPPHDHCRREGGKWIEDHEAKAAHEEATRLHGLSRAEFMAEVDAKLAELAARVAHLEQRAN